MTTLLWYIAHGLAFIGCLLMWVVIIVLLSVIMGAM